MSASSVSCPGIRLAWAGRSTPRSTPEADLELVRTGTPRTLLIQGDNLLGLQALARRTGPRFALAYLDPPFFTGRVHMRVSRSRDPKTGRVVRSERRAFDDRWDGLDAYLTALADRIAAVRELLLPEGCLVLHVDPKTSHYAKVLCDEIFGPRAFASEIVWRYRRWPSKTKNFQRVHDVLLRYVRDPDTTPRFRQLYEPLAPSTVQTWGDKKQRAIVDRTGQRLRSSRTADATLGAPMGDVWDISIVAPVARERTGYPTQKPEALLQRLIEACTNEDDLVLDPYAGSGTTLAVCARLGRTAVGMDSSRQAIQVARKRLRAVGVRPLEERVVELDEPREVPDSNAQRVA
jgi:site-specific DNA-methyltransferase (adenine-specific)